MAFGAKDLPERNKGVAPRATLIMWQAPSERCSQVNMQDDLSSFADFVGAIVASLAIILLHSWRGYTGLLLA